MEKTEMETMVSVINKLNEKGKGNEFRMGEKGLISESDQRVFKPQNLEIIKTYRFEGESDPGDSSILYVVKDKDSDLTGYFVDTYGAESNNAKLDEFIKKIPVHREEEDIFQ